LGPNGAGKSTTIAMVVGALKPDSGEVRIDGRYSAASKNARALIGVAPQALSLYEDLTADENLSFFGKLYGLSGKTLAERVNWTLGFAGLTDRRKGRVSTYSGGMKRRLNIAVALVHNPKMVVFDEPTVGIDPQSRNHIFDCIDAIKADGRSIIYTTHYMEEAERLCDRVAIMDKGLLLDIDNVEALLERHGGLSVVEAKLLDQSQAVEPSLGAFENGVLTMQSAQPMSEVAKLNASGLKFSTLSIRRPDLEAVFLNLTGRRLRDE
jgi:ABC-2 type transport system ATP-binding protein